MRSTSAFSAWITGFIVLLFANGVWFISLQTQTYSKALVLLLWIFPLLAAFITAYLSPRKKVLLGMSMALASAVIGVGFNLIYELLGHQVDFPGVRGGALLFLITLVYGVLLCSVGSYAGDYFSNGRTRRASL